MDQNCRFWLRNAVSALLLVFMLILTSVGAWAQLSQGSISGNVFDPSGAVVPNAKIIARGQATGTTYMTASSDAGTYRIPNVVVGTYDITATAQGFKTASLKGVVVQVGTTSTLDISFQTGATSEVIEVVADTPKVQSESAEIGTVVTTKQVLDLPLPLGSVVQAMRSPEAFVFLTPGATGPGTASGNGGTFESKITGGQNYATEVLLDGASTSRSENGSSFDETAPSVDALGEYKVFTSTLPADMGRTTGGIESFSTRSGTNKYHGVLYDFFRNEYLNANTFFNDFKGLPKNLDRQNDYGLTLGGPVWIPHLYNGREKTFFFFSWEQYRQTSGGVTNYTVPTALQRQGNFSETLTTTAIGTNPCDGSTIFQGQIFDPKTTQVGAGGVLCRTAYPGNIIPSTDFSSIGQALLSMYPTPQNGNIINNFAFPFSFPILDTSTTVRLDHNLSAKSKLFGSYSSRDNGRTSTTIFFNTPALDGRHQDFFTHYIRAGWDYSISSTMLNHLNVGYNRTNSKNVGAGVPEGVNWADQLGISGTAGNESKGSPFPIFRPVNEGLADLGDDVNGDTIDNGFRFNDNVEWVRGRHDWKFGTDIRHQQYSPLDFSRTTGDYFFWRQQTGVTVNTDPNAPTGNAIASELLGLVHDSNLIAHGPQPRYLSSYYSFYFQDSFKIRPTLTLMYGLRWEVDKPRRESGDNTSNIDLTASNPGANGFPGALVFAGTGNGRNGVSGDTWAKPWYKDFGPRVGFAWSPSLMKDKTVVRGGFGILYGFLLYADFGGFNRTGFQSTPGFSTPDNFGPAFVLDNGFPSGYSLPPNLDPSQLNFQGVQYVDPSFGRPPMINNWSLEVQHEIAPDLIADVAYVGQHSTHLRTNFDAQNSLHPEFLSLGSNVLNAQISSTTAANAGISEPFANFPDTQSVAQALLPFPQYFGFNTDGGLENYGQSSYNSLQASLRRRFHNGLNLLASYTWSKTLTDADAGLPFFATLHGGGSVQNPFNLNAEKAISNQDVPHTLVLSYVYELPFGKGKKYLPGGGWKDKVAGGWEVSGIHRYQSGQPLSFCCATGIPAFAGAIRFNRVQGQSLFSDQWRNGTFDPTTNDPMFNAAAFIDPNAACGTPAGCASYSFGDMPRTTGEVRMPMFLSEDFNLIKRVHITEGKNVSLQVSFLDAFNRHIFNRPGDLNPRDFNPDPSLNRFAIIDPNNTIMGPRKVQLQLKFEY